MNAPFPATLSCDVLVIGAGAAGLSCALELAPLDVLVLSGGPLGEGAATGWAQGGIAAALGADDDPGLHAADTLAASAGLADGHAVEALVAGAGAAVARLERYGARFDRGPDGQLALGLEAAHSRRRIVRAGGDATGAEVLRTLVAAVRGAAHVRVLEHTIATGLRRSADGRVGGAFARWGAQTLVVTAAATVLATGGTGALFARTTNPPGAWGRGLALAYRAGATLADLEFVQFHPTALAVDADPLPLVSEAVRGEGAVLVRADGSRLMEGVPGADLAPRDVVARAIFAEELRGGQVGLDARRVAGFGLRFPTIAEVCARYGVDPAIEPIPVTPAAHYHMGGVAVDAQGATTVAGLWACGEVAASGVHGANRLASNSVLEGLVAGPVVAAAIKGARCPRPKVVPVGPPPERTFDPRLDVRRFHELRAAVTRGAGPVRDAAGLLELRAALERWTRAWGDRSPALADALLVAGTITEAALEREESRGAHFRRDFPNPGRAATRSFIAPAEDGRRWAHA